MDFGAHRIGAGWLGIGIAAAAFTVIGGTQVAIGDWHAMLGVGPVLLVFALVCATTRTVRLDPAAGQAVVTRRLLGLTWNRQHRLDRYTTVAVRGDMYVPRHGRRDGTLLRDQLFMQYRLRLEGRGRLELDNTLRLDPAEAMARDVARLLGVPAERHGYTRTLAQGGTGQGLAQVAKRSRERLA